MAIEISIVFLPEWARLEPYLKIDEYDRDGSAVEPRIRIGFDDMPESLGREMVLLTMPCVHCQRPNYPLRRRDGDPWSRIYYAPCCPPNQRAACSKGRAATLEYERFKGIQIGVRVPAQLNLF